jgi:hypothetical protein
MAQSRADASSHIFHFDRFTITIFLLSIAHLIENEFLFCHKTFLKIELDKNCQTLLSIGQAASTCCFASILAYSPVQNFFTTGSVIFPTTLFLYTSLVSISGIETRVVFGYSKSARIVFLNICSSLGHQLSQNIFLNIQTNHDATSGLCSGFTSSSILNAIGQFTSLGSKIIAWFVLFLGINHITASAKSPCGSITATPLPFLISSIIIFSSRVDLPIQVFQIM